MYCMNQKEVPNFTSDERKSGENLTLQRLNLQFDLNQIFSNFDDNCTKVFLINQPAQARTWAWKSFFATNTGEHFGGKNFGLFRSR